MNFEFFENNVISSGVFIGEIIEILFSSCSFIYLPRQKKKQLDNPIEIRNAIADYTVTNESLEHRVRDGKEIELYD